MLLPLLGACVLVGPFQGPEWEPVRGLLEQRSCRHPRCFGNLLVLGLFVIWQVRHCWCWFTRTRSSRKKVIKVRGPASCGQSKMSHMEMSMVREGATPRTEVT